MKDLQRSIKVNLSSKEILLWMAIIRQHLIICSLNIVSLLLLLVEYKTPFLPPLLTNMGKGGLYWYGETRFRAQFLFTRALSSFSQFRIFYQGLAHEALQDILGATDNNIYKRAACVTVCNTIFFIDKKTLFFLPWFPILIKPAVTWG